MAALNGSSVLRLSEALNYFLNTKFKFCVRVLGGFFGWLGFLFGCGFLLMVGGVLGFALVFCLCPF